MSYYPEPAPGNPAELPEYIERELRRVGDAISQSLNPVELHAEPDKLTSPMIRFADGTDWDPGSGAGLYFYDGSTWTKL
jgi:hypothetical protein